MATEEEKRSAFRTVIKLRQAHVKDRDNDKLACEMRAAELGYAAMSIPQERRVIVNLYKEGQKLALSGHLDSSCNLMEFLKILGCLLDDFDFVKAYLPSDLVAALQNLQELIVEERAEA